MAAVTAVAAWCGWGNDSDCIDCSGGGGNAVWRLRMSGLRGTDPLRAWTKTAGWGLSLRRRCGAAWGEDSDWGDGIRHSGYAVWRLQVSGLPGTDPLRCWTKTAGWGLSLLRRCGAAWGEDSDWGDGIRRSGYAVWRLRVSGLRGTDPLRCWTKTAGWGLSLLRRCGAAWGEDSDWCDGIRRSGYAVWRLRVSGLRGTDPVRPSTKTASWGLSLRRRFGAVWVMIVIEATVSEVAVR